MSRRTERVSDQLLRELNDLLLREVRDPRARLATVSRVDISADLHHARALVSLLGSEDERAACLEALRGASGFLRTEAGRPSAIAHHAGAHVRDRSWARAQHEDRRDPRGAGPS